MLIKVKNLTRWYGEQKALDNVSFEVDSPQVLGLLGPNGAGKSTLMKILCCYIQPSSGEIEIDGLSPVHDSIAIRSKIGYLPEHNPLYLDMYVKEYLDFVGGIYLKPGKVRSRREQVLELVGFGNEANKKVGALSKGYRQRLGIAQSLIHDPGILVLDEPTSGLDPNQLEDIRSLIREIGKHKIVIFSTHIMQEAEAVCQRVLLLNQGLLVADDSMENLMRKRLGMKMISLEFNREADVLDLERIPGVLHVNRTGPCQYEIQAEGKDDVREAVFHFSVENGLILLGMHIISDSLESVFHQLTRPRPE